MAYSQGQAPLPPPPRSFQGGGNRTNKHIVGGQTANVGYGAGPKQNGMNLAMARQGYQRGMAGSFFRHTAPTIRPRFNYNGATPDAAQAMGNQLRANTMGGIRPANSPAAYDNYKLGVQPFRQHIIPTKDGFEYGGTALTPIRGVTPVPVTPPPPGPTTTAPTATKDATASGVSPAMQTIMSTGGKGAEGQTYTGNVQSQKIMGDRVAYNPAIHIGRVKLSDGSYAPLIKTATNPNGVIDPTWQKWMQASGVKLASATMTSNPDKVTEQWGGTPTATSPTTTAPPPATTTATSWNTNNLPQYGSGGWQKGSVVGGRLILGGAMINGRYVPYVNNPNKPGTTMAHPWWTD